MQNIDFACIKVTESLPFTKIITIHYHKFLEICGKNPQFSEKCI